ncbi:class E sortase [Nonomuraea sp. PA05]|uniref:class E sortase n=1 Tax=Nonomuraea sp. PA05 TaxID=2604466 RepID=UPI0011D5EE13|nr:class E sortase [Nonomuraea sp. PA05]TYB64325.1 class E sortase [Nonomuraea sp. PA05]
MRLLAARAAGAFGELVLTCGIVLTFFAVYGLYGTDGEIEEQQARLSTVWATTTAPAAVPASREEAEPVSRMSIPRLKKSWVVVEGVSQKALRRGPGHYPETAHPGQEGNFAVAAHRIPAFFWDLDRLREGDPIVVRTRGASYVYRVTEQLVVTPDAVDVLAADPGERLLTLTTCHPKMANHQRLVVHAELAETVRKDV